MRQTWKSFVLLAAATAAGIAVAGTAAAEEVFIEVKARKFAYTPSIIKVRKGDSVKLRLLSEDVQHGLFIDGYKVNTSAHPGQDGSLSFTADKPGRFAFRCSVTCGEFHPYMIGYLVVTPNARFSLFIAALAAVGVVHTVVVFRKKDT